MNTIIISIIVFISSMLNLVGLSNQPTITPEVKDCIILEDYSVICGDQAQNYFK